MLSDWVGQRGRVTPQQVEEAFAKTGLKPAVTGEDWLGEDGSCGCGLAALLAAQTPFCNRHLALTAMAQHLQLSLLYVSGFVVGWDGKNPYGPSPQCSPGLQLGYQDGMTAAQHMGLRS
jgi:hypothetical protein